MYYIEDSRFESKGAYFRHQADAQDMLEADVADLKAAGAVVTGFEYPMDGQRASGYQVQLQAEHFELLIRVIN